MSSKALDEILAAGTHARESGRFGEAAQHFQRALAINPKSPAALIGLGLLFEYAKELQRSEEMFQTAIRHASRSVEAYVNLARVLHEQKKFGEAVAYCEKALKYAPTHEMLLNNLGANLVGAGRFEDATAVYTRLAKIHPRFAKACYALGHLCTRLNRHDEAIRHFRRAMELEPQDRESATCAGECLLLTGKADEAIEYFDRALRLNGWEVRALALKSLALAQAGRTDAEKWLADPYRFVGSIQASELGWSPEEIAKLNLALSEFASHHPSMREDPPENATYHCWHSGPLADANNPDIEKLKTLIYFALEKRVQALSTEDPDHPFVRGLPSKFGLNLWAVRMSGGSKMVPHIHTAGWLSGVYYVDVPRIVNDPQGQEAGWIKFGMPRNDIRLTKQTLTRTVKPEPGLMVTFPSYFWHDTVPLPPDSQEQRLCLAFDLGASIAP